MHMLRATSILISALTLCATAGAQSADELGAPAPGASTPHAQVFSGAQNLAVLHDNGTWITGVGNGQGGADTSMIQSGFNTFGYGAQQSIPIRVADDFTVPSGDTWNLTSMTWRSYQTGASTAGSITGVTVRIWTGNPGTGTLVAGDTTTNRYVGHVWSGVYRVVTPPGDTLRAVMNVSIDMSWAPALPAGTYWLDVAFSGTLTSGPWVNPTVPAAPTDNAQQNTGAGFTPIIDGTAGVGQDFPFIVEGTGGGACPTPFTYCTAKISSSGCSPAIGFSGSNSIAAGTATVTGSMIEGGQLGVVFYGTNGMSSMPFQGGFLCVAPPVIRLPVQGSGGTIGSCNGSYTQSIAGVLGTIGAGNTAHFQIWFRDPGAASGTGLSNGLEVQACP